MKVKYTKTIKILLIDLFPYILSLLTGIGLSFLLLYTSLPFLVILILSVGLLFIILAITEYLFTKNIDLDTHTLDISYTIMITGFVFTSLYLIISASYNLIKIKETQWMAKNIKYISEPNSYMLLDKKSLSIHYIIHKEDFYKLQTLNCDSIISEIIITKLPSFHSSYDRKSLPKYICVKDNKKIYLKEED